MAETFNFDQNITISGLTGSIRGLDADGEHFYVCYLQTNSLKLAKYQNDGTNVFNATFTGLSSPSAFNGFTLKDASTGAIAVVSGGEIQIWEFTIGNTGPNSPSQVVSVAGSGMSQVDAMAWNADNSVYIVVGNVKSFTVSTDNANATVTSVNLPSTLSFIRDIKYADSKIYALYDASGESYNAVASYDTDWTNEAVSPTEFDDDAEYFGFNDDYALFIESNFTQVARYDTPLVDPTPAAPVFDDTNAAFAIGSDGRERYGSAPYIVFNLSNDPSVGDTVGTVTATDANNDAITYILGTAEDEDGALFAIDGTTGEITIAEALDNERRYHFHVQADTDAASATFAVVLVIVNVTDQATDDLSFEDEDPYFTNTTVDVDDTPEIRIRLPNGTMAGDAVVTINALDLNLDPILYRILSELVPGQRQFNQRDENFSVDANGNVTLYRALADDTQYETTINALWQRDAGTLIGSGIKVVVNVTDNDNPTFGEGFNATPQENIELDGDIEGLADENIFQLATYDNEGLAITYSLSGADASDFVIDATTGLVKVGATALTKGTTYVFNYVATNSANRASQFTFTLNLLNLPLTEVLTRAIPYTMPNGETPRQMAVTESRIYVTTVEGFLRVFDFEGNYQASESSTVAIQPILAPREPDHEGFGISISDNRAVLYLMTSYFDRSGFSNRTRVRLQEFNLSTLALIRSTFIDGLDAVVDYGYALAGDLRLLEHQALRNLVFDGIRYRTESEIDAINGENYYQRYNTLDAALSGNNLYIVSSQDDRTGTPNAPNPYLPDEIYYRLWRYTLDDFRLQERIALPDGVREILTIGHNGTDLWACNASNFYTTRAATAEVPNAPVFADDSVTFELGGNPRLNTTVGTVRATDADISSVINYSIGTGSDGTNFVIGGATGIITTRAELSNLTTYRFTVIATDDTNASDTIEVIVNVGASSTVTETQGGTAPTFPTATRAFTLGAGPTTNQLVGTVTATDTDVGSTVAYSLSGTHANLFAIGAATGIITVDGTLADDTDYTFVVTATDNESLTDTLTVTVTVLPTGTQPTEPLQPPAVPDVTTPLTPERGGLATVPVTRVRRIGRAARKSAQEIILRWQGSPTVNVARFRGWVTRTGQAEYTFAGLTLSRDEFEVIIPDLLWSNISKGDIFFTQYGKLLTVESAEILPTYLRYYCRQTGGSF